MITGLKDLGAIIFYNFIICKDYSIIRLKFYIDFIFYLKSLLKYSTILFILLLVHKA